MSPGLGDTPFESSLVASVADPTTRTILIGPALLCAAMAAVGYAASLIAGIGGLALVKTYVATASAITLLSLLGYIFLQFFRLARLRADRPIPLVAKAVLDRAPLLILPTIVFPVFLAGYTTAKTAIPFLVGYRWEFFWAEADRLIFGRDAWLISHAMLASVPTPLWEWLYTAGWGLILFFWLASVPLYAPRNRVPVLYTAMLGTWFFGGWLIAYTMSAAGPIFAHLVDPGLADRFAPLHEQLSATLDENGPIRRTQSYLSHAQESQIAATGGGISAMPSMHLATASIYVLAASRTPWVYPAIIFWLIIFFGSAHFGYHYWVDGIAAAGVAWLCWYLAEACYRPRQAAVVQRAAMAPVEPPATLRLGPDQSPANRKPNSR